MTQTPTQLSSSTSNAIGRIFGSLGHGMWLAATSSPWLGAVFCLLILSVVARIYRAFRWAPIASAGLDPSRRFGGRDRATILSRAGARCERHSLLFGRCKETEKLHADHVHPHSKGGLSLIHISEPTRQAEISYAVFCLKKKKKKNSIKKQKKKKHK